MNVTNIYQRNQNITFTAIDKGELIGWLEELYRMLFGIGAGNESVESLQNNFRKSKATFETILLNAFHDSKKTLAIATDLYEKIDSIHAMLLDDLEAIFSFDPAAKHKSEIILSYPGFYAIAVYRISHQLWKNNLPVIPRILSEYVHNKTGIDIHPGAQIGERFFIDHGTGIVIGETAIIGNNVKIYQGVTLGALNVRKEEAQVKRHPTIQDDVIIYANATILGGNTTIGHNSVIGGNVWISQSIPPHSLVFHKSDIVIKNNNKEFPEPLNYVI